MSLYMFIASDYPLPLVDNRKVKFYKFKPGVKVDLDNAGKWYYYTNESNKNSPDLLIPWGAEGADTLVVDSEEDLHELYITTGHKSNDIEWYTKKNHIYSVGFRYTDKRADELINYLKENIKMGCEIELWSIWMDEREKPTKYYCDIENLTFHDIEKVYGRKGFDKPVSMVVGMRGM